MYAHSSLLTHKQHRNHTWTTHLNTHGYTRMGIRHMYTQISTLFHIAYIILSLLVTVQVCIQSLKELLLVQIPGSSMFSRYYWESIWACIEQTTVTLVAMVAATGLNTFRSYIHLKKKDTHRRYCCLSFSLFALPSSRSHFFLLSLSFPSLEEEIH